jgi:transposase
MLAAASSPVSDPLELHAQLGRLQARLQELEREGAEREQILQARERRIEQLLDLIAILRRRRFGPSADRLNRRDDQLNLFDEAELEALLDELEATLAKERATPPEAAPPAAAPTPDAPPAKASPKRQALPAHLPRVERLVELSEGDQAALGEGWRQIGWEVSEQLAVIPRQYYILVHKRAKYVPADDTVAGAERAVVLAPRAPQFLPKAIADASLVAEVVADKFLDALPLYRQERRFAAEGVAIPRQTLAGWLIQAAERLAPILAGIKRELYRGALLQIDETRLQVLREPGRDNDAKSFMWVYRGGPPGRAAVWFQYSERRAGEVPLTFLFGPDAPLAAPPEVVALVLQSDGYAAYNALAARPEILAHAACWAHVRRKFVEAAEGRMHSAAAHQAVALIGKLYAIERALRGQPPDIRRHQRQRLSRPVLDAIKAWLDDTAPRVLPKSALGQAIAYTLGLWDRLGVFLDYGEVEIDNNLAENAIRPFVVGRKGWLFAGSPRGAHASAALYTLVETAKANGHEPRAYLRYLFEQLPLAKTPEAIDALLPFNLPPHQVPPLRQAL